MIKKTIALIGLLSGVAFATPQFYIQSTSSLQSGATIYTSSGTINNFFVSSETVRTKLTIPNGSAATDAAAIGQVGMYSLLCSSTVAVSSSTTSTSFVPSTLGCTAAMSNSSHHVLILANVVLTSTGTNAQAGAAVFFDGGSLDDAVGQCYVLTSVSGLGQVTAPCTLMEYTAPGDASSHAYRIYFKATGAAATIGTTNMTQRMLIFEVK